MNDSPNHEAAYEQAVKEAVDPLMEDLRGHIENAIECEKDRLADAIAAKDRLEVERDEARREAEKWRDAKELGRLRTRLPWEPEDKYPYWRGDE